MGALALFGAFIVADEVGVMLAVAAFIAALIPLVPYIGIAHLLDGTAELVDAAERAVMTRSPAEGLEPFPKGTQHHLKVLHVDPWTRGATRLSAALGTHR